MPEDNGLESRVRARLASLRSDDLLRALKPPSGIDLCSNDYLNLSRHPALADALSHAVRLEGCGSTGSRLLRGEREAFEALERRFAAFKGTEKSVYFSSGYLANLGVLTTLTEPGDVIFSDERNHASLIDGIRLSRARTVIFPHNDHASLARLMAETRTSGTRFIVVESLFSMDGDVAPLAEYARLAREGGASLIVDEAHAVGIYGQRGSGLIEDAGLDRDVTVSINTAGKALGVSGAFVTGSAWAIDYLVQRARPFVFSTAPPPAFAAALEASLSIVEREPERRHRLLALSRFLRDRLAADGIDIPAGLSQILPVVIGGNERALALAAGLQAEGFDVRAIRPPSVPPGTARLRISVNAGLSEDVLDRFAGTLVTLTRALKEMHPCAASS